MMGSWMLMDGSCFVSRRDVVAHLGRPKNRLRQLSFRSSAAQQAQPSASPLLQTKMVIQTANEKLRIHDPLVSEEKGNNILKRCEKY